MLRRKKDNVFEGEHTRLMGDSLGLSLDQLLMQLQQLVPLNQQEDLLVRYQQEFDEAGQRLRSGLE